MEDFNLGRFFEFETTKKIYVDRKKLLEFKHEISLEYRSEFEMIGKMIKAEMEQKTSIRFRKAECFEIYFKATDVDYDSEDVTFTG